MIKKILLSCGAAVAMASTPALAQDAASGPDIYVGGQVGYHQIDEIDFNEIGIDAQTDIDSVIYGAFGGVTIPTDSGIQFGVEGNYMFGDDAIDREYGVAALVGSNIGTNSRIFAKGGYQWVDFDVTDIALESADDLGIIGADRDLFVGEVESYLDGDDVGSGYLLGIGADIGVGPGFLRVGVDTIEFDTVRATAGFGLKF